MLKRHADTLEQRLERVVDHGFAEVERTELLRWFGQARVTRNIWRDLQDRFADLIDDTEVQLLVYEGNDHFVLINPDRLKPIAEKIGAPTEEGPAP